MKILNNILQNKISQYDQENGTELARFVAFLERGKVYEENEAKFFHVAEIRDERRYNHKQFRL